jgi:hypothetical protein
MRASTIFVVRMGPVMRVLVLVRRRGRIIPMMVQIGTGIGIRRLSVMRPVPAYQADRPHRRLKGHSEEHNEQSDAAQSNHERQLISRPRERLDGAPKPAQPQWNGSVARPCLRAGYD